MARTAGLTAAALAASLLLAEPAWAHGGLSGPADNVATVLVIAAAIVFLTWNRLRRNKELTGRRRLLLPALPVAAGGLVALAVITPSFVSTSPSKNRPLTAARLQILSPVSGSHAGPTVDVKLALRGASIVPQANVLPPKLPANQGHIHVRLDGNLISMTYGLDEQLHDLSPGPHVVQAEFVAVDHAPFKNPVVATATFTVD